MAKFTVTFNQGRRSHPLFIKILTNSSYTLTDVINLNLVKECKSVAIEVGNIHCFNAIVLDGDEEEGILGGIKSVLYYFDIDYFSDFILDNMLRAKLPDYLEEELWNRSKEIMKIFKSNEFRLESNAETTADFTVSYSIWLEAGSISIFVQQIADIDLIALTINQVLKRGKSMTGILHDIVGYIRQQETVYKPSFTPKKRKKKTPKVAPEITPETDITT